MVSHRWQLPEDISLEFHVVGPGSRFLAFLIDQCIIIAIMIIAYLIFFILLAVSGGRLANFGLILIISFGLLNILYFLFSELFFNGTTPGKRLIGLRVIMASGSAVTPSAAIIRNLMRIVDILPSFYLIGFMSLLLTKDNQRLGDIVGGTLVVKLPSHEITKAIFGDLTYRELGNKTFDFQKGDLALLDERELDLIRRFFWRSTRLSPDAKSRLSLKLALTLAKKMQKNVNFEQFSPEIFLKELFLALRDEFQSRI